MASIFSPCNALYFVCRKEHITYIMLYIFLLEETTWVYVVEVWYYEEIIMSLRYG